jgi:hypothetical protein
MYRELMIALLVGVSESLIILEYGSWFPVEGITHDYIELSVKIFERQLNPFCLPHNNTPKKSSLG